jgi:mannose-6-phosphate isomerase-like protein (cupin superfamily)
MTTRFDHRKPRLDASKIRKHSDFVASRKEPTLVLGERTQTDFGFTIPGVVSKFYETQYMSLSPHASTPLWHHAKKSRSYRVISGSGAYVELNEAKEVVKNQSLVVGEEILVGPEVAHRIICGPVRLDLHVAQDSKYTANLEELEPVESVAAVLPEDLISLSKESTQAAAPRSVPGHRRNSRAAEQIAAQRGGAAAAAAAAHASNRTVKVDSFFRNTDSGVNASPVMDFSDEG